MQSLLDGINAPKDLWALSEKELGTLCGELRQVMIETVTRQGGHLASNLGVVELTVALHRIFDTNMDRIVWDVGHQCYAHKILTGRREEFKRLRQSGGISGFPKRSESGHDAFDTGHSSTAISAAVGLARARDLQGQDHHVIAVIGDGAMTGGLAYEAINDIGQHLDTRLIVILNDNEMSISHNVGAMSAHLSGLRANPKYGRFKKFLGDALNKVPVIGAPLLRGLTHIRDSVKYLFMSGAMFDQLGLKYLGPIDGHNIRDLSRVLQQAKKMLVPVVIHVVTTKGKGYQRAERHPEEYHGMAPYVVEPEGSAAAHKVSFSDALSKWLIKEMKTDDRRVAVTAAMAAGTGLLAASKAHPDRFFDVGIAEAHAVTMSAGMAAGGMRPLVAVYSTFMQRAYDSIAHDVCNQGLPVLICLDRAGLSGEDGATHHGIYDLSYLNPLPGITILAPGDPAELTRMLNWAKEQSGPVAIRYPRSAQVMGACVMLNGPTTWTVMRAGLHARVLALGTMVHTALQLARLLHEKGISIEVVYANSVKPLDEKLLLACPDDGMPVITLEEHMLSGGFGSAVGQWRDARNKSFPLHSFGVPDQLIEHGNVEQLLEQAGLTAPALIQPVTDIIMEHWQGRPPLPVSDMRKAGQDR